MRKETLTSQERVRLALNHQAVDRIPIALICSGINPPAYQALDDTLRRERGLSAAAYLDGFLDVAEVTPAYRGPALRDGRDIFGVRWQGDYEHVLDYPLAGVTRLSELEAYPWPSPDCYDFAAIPARIAALQDVRPRAILVSLGHIFEYTWFMRGLEQAYMDFLLHPELIHAVLERVTNFYVGYFTNLLAAGQGQIDLVLTADDIAGQEHLLMSLPTWEEFIKPYHVRLNQVVHNFGVRVIYHSDGALMKAVPGLIDMGVDILQALQFDARGMDPLKLKTQYGGQLCFQGGVSVQKTLPFGTPREVQAEVETLTAVLGQGGGYILGPSNVIQAGTPPENILAMFDTALRCK